MAITPRSKGLGNIGAIVDRQGRASPAMKAPVKPVVKAAPKPAAKPVARVAPKPAPKMAPAPKPSPFKNQQQPIREGTGQLPPGFGAPSPIDRSQLGGAQRVGGPVDKPIIGGPPRNDLILPPFKMPTPGNGGAPKPQPQPGRDPELADMPDDLYNNMMAYNKSRDDQMQAAKAAGDPYWFAIPESADIKPWQQWQMDYNERKTNASLPPPMAPQYNPSMGGTQDLYNQYNRIGNRMTDNISPVDKMNFQQFVGYINGTYTPPPDDDYTMPGEPNDYTMPGEPNIPPGNYQDPYMPPEPPPGYDYGGPYMPRPNIGPGVGFGVGLPQPGQDLGNFYPGEPAPYTGGMMSPRRVINQVGKPGFQPRPTMQSAFSPDSNNFGGDGFMGGSGSMFGGGGFAGK